MTSTSVYRTNDEWMNGTSWWQSRLRQLGWGGAAGLPVDLQGHPAKDPRFLPRWHVWILPETLRKDCTTVLCKTTRKMKDSEDGSSRMHRLNNGYQSLLRGTYWWLISIVSMWLGHPPAVQKAEGPSVPWSNRKSNTGQKGRSSLWDQSWHHGFAKDWLS